MKFCSLASGSSGNCEYIEYKNTKILIDAGLSGKKIEELLNSIDVKASEIDAIFVTHEHIDHIKGVGVLSRRYGTKVFATPETFNRMLPTTKEIKTENSFFFENSKPFHFKDLFVEPISSFHDCANGTCFSITGSKKVSIVTDTGWISSEMLEKMANSALYYIEANHDYEMLINGSYPWSLKQRISSNRGHLSNENTAEILQKLITRRKEVVMLSHLSRDNNLPMLATRTVRDFLSNKNILEGTDYILEVSPREEASKVHRL
ncbi:MBL fold metallo-hydrolase [Anaerosphaera multitolerans]|uniref:MBL fold metallo-hydrolase n=1 Tax=Anaerosphaera multitolerans TaxID=2487351 RepID=A0A437S9U5_9FIRM|nr:MBL fold metallo-hydrolase [Anaerosphaera multitolerans]RVU55651.1 MBL fold metallo-hydrolase [Anaerosphaera multitolerans]